MANWCPAGYVPFEELVFGPIKRLWQYEGRPPNWAPTSDVPSDLTEAVVAFIGPRLIEGTIRAAGILTATGRMVWIPRETWRLTASDAEGGYSLASNIDLALFGGPIRIPRTDEPSLPCMPVLPARYLDEWFGLDPPSPAPAVEPDDLDPAQGGAVELPAAQPSAAEDADTIPPEVAAWMRGYALGWFHGTKQKAQREPTIKVCMQDMKAAFSMAVRYKQAEKAWGRLPEEWKSWSRRPKE